MKNNHRSVDNITSNIILNNKIEKEEEKNIKRNDFINLIRNKLFNKFKKEEKYQSAMNFKVIDYENIFEINIVNNEFKNNIKKNFKYPKVSNIFDMQTKKF